jgi:hypothetical protein
MQDQIIYAYAAALMDGEGTISLMKNRSNERRTVILEMSSTTIELLQFMKDHFGGTICNKLHKIERYKQAWRWKLVGPKALSALEQFVPYLLEPIKRKRAEYLIENYKANTSRNGKYTPEMLKRRIEFEEEFFKIC